MAKKKSVESKVSPQKKLELPRWYGETLGQRLRELRLIRGVTAVKLSEKTGVNVSRVLSIETAGRDMQVGTVYSYCHNLGFRLADVFEEFPVCTELETEMFARQSGLLEGQLAEIRRASENEDFVYMASRIIGLCRKYPELAGTGVKLILEAANTLADDEAAPMTRWFKNPPKAS